MKIAAQRGWSNAFSCVEASDHVGRNFVTHTPDVNPCLAGWNLILRCAVILSARHESDQLKPRQSTRRFAILLVPSVPGRYSFITF